MLQGIFEERVATGSLTHDTYQIERLVSKMNKKRNKLLVIYKNLSCQRYQAETNRVIDTAIAFQKTSSLWPPAAPAHSIECLA